MAKTFQTINREELYDYFENCPQWESATELVAENYPNGRERVAMNFVVHTKDKKGSRVLRWFGDHKAKATVYYAQCRIVRDHDGQIIIVGLTEGGQMVIQWGNLKFPEYLYYRPNAIADMDKFKNGVWIRCAQLLGIKYHDDMRIPEMEKPCDTVV